jgi:hypothetical protein
VNILNEEPVAVGALVGTMLTMLVLFGLPISAEEQAAVIAFVVAAITWWQRSQVTPWSPPARKPSDDVRLPGEDG